VISLKNSLPLLRKRDDETTLLRKDWLCGCVLRAADKTGYAQWWLAEHVTDSVLCYLSTAYEHNTVTLDEMEQFVRSVLQSIGYAEIALCFEAFEPPYELSLEEIAKEAGSGFELAFFQLLKERIQPAFSAPLTSIHLYGLQSCVRSLQSVKTWSRNCSQLRSEIVEFVRTQLEYSKAEILLTIK
jgi:hypothetical protein